MHFRDLLSDTSVIAGTFMAATAFSATSVFIALVPSPVVDLIDDPARTSAYTEYCKNAYTGHKILVSDEAGLVREALPIIEMKDCLDQLHQKDVDNFNISRIFTGGVMGLLSLGLAGAGAVGLRDKIKYESPRAALQ